MPAAFPNFGRGQFQQDHPPTLFHPASPKMKPSKPSATKDFDTASIASTSTFASTVSLLKTRAKRTLPDFRARKDAEKTIVYLSEKEEVKEKKKREPLPKDTKSPRARTAEAYMFIGMNK